MSPRYYVKPRYQQARVRGPFNSRERADEVALKFAAGAEILKVVDEVTEGR